MMNLTTLSIIIFKKQRISNIYLNRNISYFECHNKWETLNSLHLFRQYEVIKTYSVKKGTFRYSKLKILTITIFTQNPSRN